MGIATRETHSGKSGLESSIKKFYCVRLPILTGIQTKGYHELTNSIYKTLATNPYEAVRNIIFRYLSKAEARKIILHFEDTLKNYGPRFSLDLDEIKGVDYEDTMAIYFLAGEIKTRLHSGTETSLKVASSYLDYREKRKHTDYQ